MPVQRHREFHCVDRYRLRKTHGLSMRDLLCRPSLCLLLIVKLSMNRTSDHQSLDLRSAFVNFGSALIPVQAFDERRLDETFSTKYLNPNIDRIMRSFAAKQFGLCADERNILASIEVACGFVCQHSTC